MSGFVDSPVSEQPPVYVEIDVDEDASVKIRARSNDDLISVGEGIRLPFGAALSDLASFSNAVVDRLSSASPTEMEITFGVGFEVSAGKLTSLIMDSKGDCTLAVKLKWSKSDVKPADE